MTGRMCVCEVVLFVNFVEVVKARESVPVCF